LVEGQRELLKLAILKKDLGLGTNGSVLAKLVVQAVLKDRILKA